MPSGLKTKRIKECQINTELLLSIVTFLFLAGSMDETQHQWLTPGFLATQEAGLRFEASPGQIVCKTLSQKKPQHTKKGLVEWLKG
jgi:hypothetical protein